MVISAVEMDFRLLLRLPSDVVGWVNRSDFLLRIPRHQPSRSQSFLWLPTFPSLRFMNISSGFIVYSLVRFAGPAFSAPDTSFVCWRFWRKRGDLNEVEWKQKLSIYNATLFALSWKHPKAPVLNSHYLLIHLESLNTQRGADENSMENRFRWKSLLNLLRLLSFYFSRHKIFARKFPFKPRGF